MQIGVRSSEHGGGESKSGPPWSEDKEVEHGAHCETLAFYLEWGIREKNSLFVVVTNPTVYPIDSYSTWFYHVAMYAGAADGQGLLGWGVSPKASSSFPQALARVQY